MGMYDYIGDDGSQVKCFYVPYIVVKKNDKSEYRTRFITSGGRMVSVNDAPFMTPYYNYGPNFAILDYGILWNGNDTIVHIMENGKWVNTYTVEELGEDYKLPPVVICADGARYKVKTVADIKQMIQDYTAARKEQKELTVQYFKLRGMNPEVDFEKIKTMSEDEVHQEFAIRNVVHQDVLAITVEPVVKKYEDKSHLNKASMLGQVYAYYQECIARQIPHYEFQWYVACKEAIEILKEKHSMSEPIVSYITWCNQEGIKIDVNDVIAFFDKYTKEAPEELRIEFEKAEERGC